MKLYLVDRTDGTSYAEYDAVVVRAESKEAAIEFVCKHTRKLVRSNRVPVQEWISVRPAYGGFQEDGSNAKATVVTAAGEPGEVLSSYNAG